MRTRYCHILLSTFRHRGLSKTRLHNEALPGKCFLPRRLHFIQARPSQRRWRRWPSLVCPCVCMASSTHIANHFGIGAKLCSKSGENWEAVHTFNHNRLCIHCIHHLWASESLSMSSSDPSTRSITKPFVTQTLKCPIYSCFDVKHPAGLAFNVFYSSFFSSTHSCNM